MTSYENLNQIYDPRLTIVPSGRTTPTIQNTCEGIYKSLSNILYNHLTNKTTIDKDTDRNSYELLKVHENSIEDGFELLFTIVQQQSPHLGGYGDDPLDLVTKYEVERG